MSPSKLELRFLDDRPGPAEPISDERARRIVDGAVDRVFAGSSSPWRGRVASKWPFLLAATLVVGVAAASSVITARHRPAPAPAPAPATAPATATATAPAPATATALAPAPAQENPSPVRTVRPPPEDLLRQANDLRAARRWKEATRAYERVMAVHPGTPEAYAAAVAAADLHLEQLGDPRGALRLYRGALARSAQGPLGEQALWGSARCAGALGDRDGERRALQDYVARYPSGLFEAVARTRLAELERATQ
jgi:hypothetical protein